MGELSGNAIVEFFISKLNSFDFIDKSLHKQIRDNLELIADKKTSHKIAIDSSVELWRIFTERSLNEFTGNTRGYYELNQYFNHYKEYENVLFALDNNHRDHVIHLIWVLLLGVYLKETFKPFQEFRYGDSVTCRSRELEGYKSTLEGLKGLEMSLWFLISLTHDLGYPIEKTWKANQIMSKMINHFGFLELEEFKYRFSVVHQTAIETLLSTLSSKVYWKDDNSYSIITVPGIKLDYAKSIERLDHGIMGAYLLQSYLDVICDSMLFYQGDQSIVLDDKDDAINFAFISEWLTAISEHTNMNQYTSSLDCMGSLLCVCDELDEFSRYAHSNDGDEWVRTSIRTEFECSEHKLEMIYTLGDPDIEEDIESLFKFKVRSICNRFEVEEEDIRNLIIVFRDIRKVKVIEWKYEKSLPDKELGEISSPNATIYNVRDWIME